MLSFIAIFAVIIAAAIWLAVAHRQGTTQRRGLHRWETTRGKPVSAVTLTLKLRRENDLLLTYRLAQRDDALVV